MRVIHPTTPADAGGRATKDNSDAKIAYGKIARFLADKLARTDAEHQAPRLITSVKEISRRTGVDERTVRKYLSKREGELVDEGVALIRVGGTYAMIKLGPEEAR